MTQLKVWAPNAHKVELDTAGQRSAMQVQAGGWWIAEGRELEDGDDYAFWLDDEGPFPDPRSPFQPSGVHGPSRWIEHSRFVWTDGDWQPLDLADAIIYELHIGTFTPEGTFESAIARLDHLCALGITHVELMPVAEFDGQRGWGYDGVNLYAPHHYYGGPEGLKRLVDACHQRGLAVLLDVVYNHLGPEGNHLERFGPYFTDMYHTPWGKAINLDGPGSDEVRHFLIENALMWLRDYHMDGVRIDAIHAFIDRSAVPFLEQLGADVKLMARALGRKLVVTVESDLNDSRVVRPVDQGGMGMDAQWSDDFHHALHALLTGERAGYYADFDGLADLARTICSGYVYEHRYSSYRKRRHGRSAAGLGGERFITCLQNHDQVGNRCAGERISHLVGAERSRLGALISVLSPSVPLLFQGEEWAASTPFQYFTGFTNDELGQAVRSGRQAEFAAFGWASEAVPDPQDIATWQRSRLRWDETVTPPHQAMLDWYTALIRLRRRNEDFRAGPLDTEGVAYDDVALWLRFRRGRFLVFANFSDAPCQIPSATAGGLRLVLTSEPQVALAEEEDATQVLLPPHSGAVVEVAD